MALRLRRGTDAQRQLITPIEGELIYVTDTTELYVGDGTTLGGIRITGEVVNNIEQLDNVDAALPQDGDVLVYDSLTGDWIAAELPLGDLSDVDLTTNPPGDGQVLSYNSGTASWVPANNLGGGGATFTGDITGSVFGDDSTLLVDAVNNTLTGNLIGNVTGLIKGEDTSTVLYNGDSLVDAFFKGNIKAGNGSNILVNGADGTDARFTGEVIGNIIGNVNGDAAGDHTGTFTGEISATGTLDGNVTGDVYSDGSTVVLNATAETILLKKINPNGTNGTLTISAEEETSRVLIQKSSSSAIGDTDAVGRLLFGKNESGVETVVHAVSITNNQMSFIPQPGGTPNYNNYMKLYKTGTVQISMAGEISNAPGDAKLEVGGAVLYKPMTTTVRDALTAAAGMVIFNTTDTKLQVYDGSAWVDLH